MTSNLAQTEQKQILEQIKSILKQRKLTYQQLAKKSEIPVSSLKKIFAGGDCSLSRILEICQCLDVSFIELAGVIAKEKKEDYFRFTLDQEKFFAKNMLYYRFFHKVFRDNLAAEETRDFLGLDDKMMWKILKKLESFQLLQIEPGLRLKFLVSGGLIFLEEGPLQDLILSGVANGFVDYLINGEMIKEPVDSPFLRLYFAKMTVESYEKFLAGLKELHHEAGITSLRDRRFQPKENLIDVTWLMGLGNVNGLDLLHEKKK